MASQLQGAMLTKSKLWPIYGQYSLKKLLSRYERERERERGEAKGLKEREEMRPFPNQRAGRKLLANKAYIFKH